MKQLINKGLEYADLLIKPSLTEVGLLISDPIKVFRHKRNVRLIENVKRFHEKNAITPKAIQLKTFASIFEHSSLEEDDTLHDMWAMLLAKATSPGNASNTNLFSSILRELSPEEAEILTRLFAKYEINQGVQNFGFRRPLVFFLNSEKRFPPNVDREVLRIEMEDEQVMVDNLIRLNLIEYVKVPGVGHKGHYGRRKDFVGFTRLAVTFLKEVLSRS